MKNFLFSTAIYVSMLISAGIAGAQAVPFDSDRWELHGTEKKVLDYLGQRSLDLRGGAAIVKDSEFTDGVIEFDIAFSNERNFTGVMWRWQDPANREEFYFRPHQSGNPDANQYEPVFNGIAAWQLYYGERYAAPVKYDFNQWMHIKIVVSGAQAEVYIRDMTTPVLVIGELKRAVRTGKVGLRADNLAPAYYSNFSFTPLDRPAIKGTPKPPETAQPGTVMSWEVSNTIDGKSLDKKYRLTDADKQALSWQKLPSESSGLANLARLQGLGKGKDTTFARVVIESDSDQIKRFQFGFSDIVKVYFNDRLLYGGSDLYRSRDYRFLGTIGLFDELYLPLKKGDNELWLAVTETVGGWGVKARFDDMNGIRFKD